jgi:putative transposase
MVFNPQKHHRRSIRLRGYDYTRAGVYFVTMCVRNREMLLGSIVDGNVKLNDTGVLVHNCWNQLSNKYPDVDLDTFIIMPDHLHGIVFIHDKNHDTINVVGARSPRPYNGSLKSHKSTKSQPTLGKIIAYFKYQTTKHINQIQNTPGIKFWQRNYYEHIIRNENELICIRKYIIQNPSEWDLDENNPYDMGFN